ncbi:MAG: uroporphyrinogen-III synthase [Longimicrobiales bacterium]
MTRLDGRVVATTRDGSPDDTLVAELRAAGARVLVWPTLSFEPPDDATPLARALTAPDGWDWVLLTSARSVAAQSEHGSLPVGGARIAAVGGATAAALLAGGWRVDLVGDGGGASGLIDAMLRETTVEGTRILFPAATGASSELEDALGAEGARVTRVDAYRTVLSPPDPARVRADLADGVDVVAFASPSAVAALDDTLDHDLARALAPCRVAAIGPTTARALADRGVDAVVASDTSFDALVAACADRPPTS